MGDKWTLVIVKQMLLENRKTFKDFLEADEGIATNILSTRLKWLEGFEFITKEKLTENKKTNIYRLTEKGLSLTPIIVELAYWSNLNLRELNPIMQESIPQLMNDKEGFVELLKENYRSKF
ncbi:MAG: helix-turn-helix transcriptional regulator [Cyanothece sp. SIO1E1]|nr:helix-turn-helix transcriptional regulator [Cyanothece sp. SIO1E1]